MAEMEEREWVASVDKWNAEVDRRERMGGIAKAVAKPVRARAVPLLPACKTGEQHTVGVVLGRLGGNRTDCNAGTRNSTAEHMLY
jgi:hypothetical protein